MRQKKSPRRSGSQHTGKCKNNLSQTAKIRLAIAESPKTRRELEIETGVHYNTLDYALGQMKKANTAFVAYLGKCPISGVNKVQFITSNPNYKPL